MKRIVTAICNALPTTGVPTEIVYVPEGKTKIYPQSHPGGIWVNLPPDKGPVIAAAFDAALKKKLTENVRPWVDFEHTAKYPSAGIPTGFRYESGVGLMCAMDWSGSGREAIERRDVRYFSPRFDLNEAGIPVSLPDRGPLGGLVTEPAFRDMRPIAASVADNPNPSDPMFQILASCGILTASEVARDNAETLASQRVAEWREDSKKLVTASANLTAAETDRDNWKKKFEDLEASNKTEAETRAKTKVEAAVAAGKLKKDDERVAYFVERITAGDAMAERILDGLGVQHPGIDKPIVNGGQTVAAGATVEHAFLTEARKTIEAGQAKSQGEAFQIVSSAKPDLYDSYQKSLYSDG